MCTSITSQRGANSLSYVMTKGNYQLLLDQSELMNLMKRELSNAESKDYSVI